MQYHTFINLLKPSSKFMYHQEVFTLHLCVLYGSQNKQQLLPYRALRDCFLKLRLSVYCAVQNESLYKTDTFHLERFDKEV